MKGKQLSMNCIRKILEYRLDNKISADRTSLALKVSKGSIINLLKRFKTSELSWPLPQELSDTKLREILYPRKPMRQIPSSELPDIKHLLCELSRPHMTLQRLWEEYHADYPNGLKRSAYYRYITKNRPPEVSMKIHHKGGDKLFVDYSGKGLEYIDITTGEIISVELFVACWGASSFCYAEATRSQKQEDFVMSHQRAFQYFKVIPNAIVPDNLKSAVVKADRYNPLVNRLYSLFCNHFSVTVLPARPRKPKDKAVVESNVLHIQRTILAKLRNRQFFSLNEVNVAIREELKWFNNRPMKDYGNQTRQQRFEVLDRPYANPLRKELFKIIFVKENVKVAKDYHISFNKHFYSVPWENVGKRVEVRQTSNLIEIYHDNILICYHPVSWREYGYTTETKHMPKKHQFIKGWSPGYFLDQAKDIGASTTKVIELTMNRKFHPEQGFKASMAVLRLAKQYSSHRLEKACERALAFNNYRCSVIKSILSRNLDQKPIIVTNKTMQENIVTHDNIRGALNYKGE